ncbi:response regulator transcription factor [Nguyenibacter vanlangensis]|uniref:Response regulator n=1 Tax=Nguyenibacter vanlangensis TaxID=1216886 RepID=A0A7Y7M3W4_9PROT|nr:response regulator [Nguyenibacter vanlangensis]NVN10105.1 response regulator [Nguyenibacter vanlangensis]
MLSNGVICVVDDDEDVRESIGAFFRSAGIPTEKFDGAEALLAWPGLASMRCLITDLHMPGMNGLDLQRELKRRGRVVPVILMSAYPTHDSREQAKALGVSFFATKPADPEVLLEQVEALHGK